MKFFITTAFLFSLIACSEKSGKNSSEPAPPVRNENSNQEIKPEFTNECDPMEIETITSFLPEIQNPWVSKEQLWNISLSGEFDNQVLNLINIRTSEKLRINTQVELIKTTNAVGLELELSPIFLFQSLKDRISFFLADKAIYISVRGPSESEILKMNLESLEVNSLGVYRQDTILVGFLGEHGILSTPYNNLRWNARYDLFIYDFENSKRLKRFDWKVQRARLAPHYHRCPTMPFNKYLKLTPNGYLYTMADNKSEYCGGSKEKYKAISLEELEALFNSTELDGFGYSDDLSEVIETTDKEKLELVIPYQLDASNLESTGIIDFYNDEGHKVSTINEVMNQILGERYFRFGPSSYFVYAGHSLGEDEKNYYFNVIKDDGKNFEKTIECTVIRN